MECLPKSKVDECVLFRVNVIFLCYVDDGIFAGPELEREDSFLRGEQDVSSGDEGSTQEEIKKC